VTADALGPIFISYRQSDGTATAVDTAWALRAAGVPVWQDRDDLPLGETEHVLETAIAAGLSGAVLTITPQVEHSAIIRALEAPALLDQADTHPDAFTLQLASTVERPESDQLDYDAPDRLLQRPLGTFRRFDQRPARTGLERADLARRMSRERLRLLADRIRESGHLRFDIQTRVAPEATTVAAPLVVRLRPPQPGTRLPNRAGLEDLVDALVYLPDVVANAVARADSIPLRLTGGAHLSVATAIGIALPRTLLGRAEVQDGDGAIWAGGSSSDENASLIRVLGHGTGPGLGDDDPEVVCFVDLIPQASDAAYAAFLHERKRLAAWRHLRPSSPGALDPTQAGPLVAAVAAHVRELSIDARGARVHLLLRTPWSVAFLLGRQLNTHDVTLYEWTGPSEDTYQAVLRFRDGPQTAEVLGEHQ